MPTHPDRVRELYGLCPYCGIDTAKGEVHGLDGGSRWVCYISERPGRPILKVVRTPKPDPEKV